MQTVSLAKRSRHFNPTKKGCSRYDTSLNLLAEALILRIRGVSITARSTLGSDTQMKTVFFCLENSAWSLQLTLLSISLSWCMFPTIRDGFWVFKTRNSHKDSIKVVNQKNKNKTISLCLQTKYQTHSFLDICSEYIFVPKEVFLLYPNHFGLIIYSESISKRKWDLFWGVKSNKIVLFIFQVDIYECNSPNKC